MKQGQFLPSLFRLQLHWALRGNKSLVPTWMLAASVKGTEQNSSANKYTELLRAPGMQMVKMSLVFVSVSRVKVS
ncbi:hypothetical protein Pcinc_024576 [Petrolisthes cinctipes]|uniref:Uncharacterized protein n=1 Tax=Petrolisthes cinctipes TaxID=88211 RepID=A0AAE1KCT3_PETCI|nr:hypothetical protein Pcinc_024576 [Petrolisthes cinctipes]